MAEDWTAYNALSQAIAAAVAQHDAGAIVGNWALAVEVMTSDGQPGLRTFNATDALKIDLRDLHLAAAEVYE